MRDISRLQSIVYNGLMEARFKPTKNLVEILDETIDWIIDDHFVKEYGDTSPSVRDPWCEKCLRPFPCKQTVEECKNIPQVSSGKILEAMLKCSVPYYSSTSKEKEGEE